MSARARTVACRVCWQRRPWVGSIAGGVDACWSCMQRRIGDLAATAADALEHVGLAREAHHVREGGSLRDRGDGGVPCTHAATLVAVLSARPANTVGSWRVPPRRRPCTHAPDVTAAEYVGVQRVVEPQDADALYTCRACGTTFGDGRGLPTRRRGSTRTRTRT